MILKITIFFKSAFSELILSRNSHCNKTSTQTTQAFHEITYNTAILELIAIKFFVLN